MFLQDSATLFNGGKEKVICYANWSSWRGDFWVRLDPMAYINRMGRRNLSAFQVHSIGGLFHFYQLDYVLALFVMFEWALQAQLCFKLFVGLLMCFCCGNFCMSCYLLFHFHF